MSWRGRIVGLAALVAVVALSWLGSWAAGAGVSMQAEDKELGAVLALVASHGGPPLAAHAEAGDEQWSFATRQMSRTGAIRWLCRACGLAVARGKGGKAVVGKPSTDGAELEKYKIASLVGNDDEAEALVRFIRAVILAAFESREEGEGEGDAGLPEAEALYQGERLKVLAPGVVHREVLALLQAMARAKERGDVEQMTVKYSPYDLGFFRASTGAKPPSPKGAVALELDGATAAEAAWQLTTRSQASFYVDARDPGLAKATVSLTVRDKPLAFAASAVAEALGARLVTYDGAWLFVRPARRPLYEGLVVRVYYVGGEVFGRSVGEIAAWRARQIELPEGLPYAIERVGDRLLASAPLDVHEQLEDITTWRRPRDGRDGRGGRPNWGGPRGGRGR